ncbi:MAG: hypothetical protein EBX52_10700, partial [Proteobacteria bacterium]|nr:hypothetical protein [Pseudomonadota bacterium]
AVYRSAGENSASGALTIRGENQAALDLAKIKVNGELIEIEERSRRLHPDLPVARDGEQIFPGGEFDPDSRSVIYNELMERIRRHETIEAELTSRIEALKHDDHRKAHEIEQLKIQRLNMIDLLHSKERDLVRRDAEYRNLKIRIEGGGSRAQAASSELDATVKAFREKAVEMYQKLKAVQIENLELEAQLRMLRHENSVESPEVGGEEFGEGTTIRPSTEDLEKKVDRLQRTLEAEKAKVKGLLDRALIAEKEAQTSAPIISDLEAKVEFQLKTSVQYKKEIDNLKLKVVQAEAEKNKVKNELLKAQAQVQTLNKRLAG